LLYVDVFTFEEVGNYSSICILILPIKALYQSSHPEILSRLFGMVFFAGIFEQAGLGPMLADE
jgi:hypothetical protein